MRELTGSEGQWLARFQSSDGLVPSPPGIPPGVLARLEEKGFLDRIEHGELNWQCILTEEARDIAAKIRIAYEAREALHGVKIDPAVSAAIISQFKEAVNQEVSCPYCRSEHHNEDTEPCPVRCADVRRHVEEGKRIYGT